TVDGAEAKFALLSLCSCSRNIVENPFNLGAGEVRIGNETSLLFNHHIGSFLLQLITVFCRSPVLPYDRVVNWLVCFPVPDNCSLSLIGDADGGDVLY